MKLFKSILLGVLFNISQKAGPTVVLFSYLYALHHFVTQSGGKGLPMSTGLMLILAVVTVSVVLMGLKTVIGKARGVADVKTLPLLDAWCLRRIFKGDMRPMRIRVASKALLEGLVTGTLFVLLTVIAFTASLSLALMLVAVLVTVTAMTYYLPKRFPGENDTLLQHAMRPDVYAEQILIFGLLFVLAMQASADASMVHSSIMVFLIARFGGAFKTFARSFKRILMSRRFARQFWINDKLAKQQRAVSPNAEFAQQLTAE